MKTYTNSSPVFSRNISIVETSDPAHADNVNAAPKQLLQNTLANRDLIQRTRLSIHYDQENEAIVINGSGTGEDAAVQGSMAEIAQMAADIIKSGIGDVQAADVGRLF